MENTQNNSISELPANDLMRSCEDDTFDFPSTEELEGLDGVIGQDRATQALSFGMDIESPGYHVYAMGEPGTGRISSIKNFLKSEAKSETVPQDWCYVNNFDEPDNPQALRFPAGRGQEFKNDMKSFTEQIKKEISQAFDSEEFENQREQIWKQFQEERQEIFEELEDTANKEDLTLLQTQHGIMVAPLVDGEAVSPDEFSNLDEETREDFESARKEIQDDLRGAMREVQDLQSEVRDQMKELDRQILGVAIEPLIEKLKNKYSGLVSVVEYLEEIQESLMNNVQQYKQMEQYEEMQQQVPMVMQQQGSLFDSYRVNLVVDHSDSEGAPVIHETNPTYYNLVGRIEHQGKFGSMTTDYTMIKRGALHRANGGYLMLEAKDVLTTPFAWNALKRSLDEGKIKTEVMGQEYRAIQTQTLEPEAIPLDVKVVLIGNPLIYYLLYNVDEEFHKLFRVKADFDVQADWDQEIVQQYAQYIGLICDEEGLSHFNPSGVSRIVEEGARVVADQNKLAVKLGDLADLVRQSSYWSKKNGNELVSGEDVQEAIDERIYRSNRLEERIRELIDENTILIDTQGTKAGQVNGISVMPLGDYSFGKPTRITARTFTGDEGIVNIERETDMGGQIHNKGAMILTGYLGGEFAQEDPLSFSASITFEQTYQGVEGDSASSTELYAILSSLADMPIKQNLAVTGSVNQHGTIQSIGGVNEKIHGFFKVCEAKGLTGDQGVLIPQSNVKNLMLRREVIEAVQDDEFHIYPVNTVDEGIEILTGMPAGERQEEGSFPDGTVKKAVQTRLKQLTKTVNKSSMSQNS